MNKSRLFAAAIFAGSLVPNMALAAMLATALTDLNVRAGPGPEYPVIGVIRAQEPVTMVGCIEGSLWCQINHKGKEGWAYAQYLATQSAGNRVIISERRPDVVVPSVTYTRPPGATIAVAPVTGALVAGPGTVTVGGAPVTVFDPPQQVRTYVTSNPVDPVYLEGEVVVGAGLP
jgi:uncharacterized protein YraI